MTIDNSQHPFTVWRADTLTTDLPLSQLLQHVVSHLPDDVRAALTEQRLRFLSHRTPEATNGLFSNCEISSDGLQYIVHLAPIRLRSRTYEWAKYCVAAELAAAYIHFGYPRAIHELALEMLDQFCMQDTPEYFRTSEHGAADLSVYVGVLSSLVRRDAYMHASPLYRKRWVGALTRMDSAEQDQCLGRLTDAGWLSTNHSQKAADASPEPNLGIGPLPRALHAGTVLVTPQRAVVAATLGRWLSTTTPQAWIHDAAVQARWPGDDFFFIGESGVIDPQDDLDIGDIPF